MKVLTEIKLLVMRKQRGLSQKDLGLMTGLETSYLSNLENGNITPHITTAWKIASSLGCYIEEIWKMKRDHTPEGE